MKEIDFLPEWYRSGKRFQISVRRQYIALAGIFAAMLIWNFIAGHSVSEAKAQLAQMAANRLSTENATLDFDRIKARVAELQEKADILERIDSKIDVANVLAEISFLADKKIVLGKVEFDAESFIDSRNGKAGGRSTVRAARTRFGGKGPALLGDVRFKVLINGLAAEAGDMAELILRLEDSPYFCQVALSFSRNTEVKTPGRSLGRGGRVTEFQITCCLANYRIEEPYVAENTETKRTGR